MTQATKEKVPIPTLERLATYLRFLIDLQQSHVDTISSSEVERQTGINAAQFRKDLSHFYSSFGEFGKSGVGYNVQDLQSRITHILKIDREQRVILVGAGNLGSALVGYPGLKEHHFNLVAVFDSNPDKIGCSLSGMEIIDIQHLKEANSLLGARIAILAVPAIAAQHVADLLVEAGIHAILNFAPVPLRCPDPIYVRNVSFLQELAVLSYHLSGDLLTSLPSPLSAPSTIEINQSAGAKDLSKNGTSSSLPGNSKTSIEVPDASQKPGASEATEKLA